MIRLRSVTLRRHDLRTRLPFRYGIVTMTELPHVILHVTLEIDGHLAKGIAADHLPPKWFTKNPSTALADEIEDMLAVITRAAEHARDLTADSLFAWWGHLFRRQEVWAERLNVPRLLAHFGTALVERAAHDAFCRHHGQPWHALLHSPAFGIDWCEWEPTLSDLDWRDLLPSTPLARVTVRHTVGMADPLRAADVIKPLDDGLPESLAAAIARYGLSEFKLKLSGQANADLARLRATAAVITTEAPADFRFSLDANEQFTAPAELRRFGETVLADADLRRFFEHLAFIEQPLNRHVALAPDQADIRDAWPAPVPFIIDESDGAWADLPRALALGYAGVSHKNCKGLFKGLRNALLVAHHRRASPYDRPWMTSGEDLANLGPVALLQDLAVQAALGNASVERNGHHYFAGLAWLPPALAAATVTAHPDLYAPDESHGATLRITAGELDLTTVNAAALGCALSPASAWPGEVVAGWSID